VYDERAAAERGSPFFEQGYRLMARFLDLGWDGASAAGQAGSGSGT
jgi:hypothetical protein